MAEPGPSSVTRKRLLSDVDDELGGRKRLRSYASLSAADLLPPAPSPTRIISTISYDRDTMPRPRTLLDEQYDALTSVASTRPLSSSSSFTAGSRSGSPSPFVSNRGLIRSASSSSLRSTAPPVYPQISSRYNLRDSKVTIDFSLPTAMSAESESRLPIACSSNNVVYFSRGNRVHFKNLQTNEEIGQLLKLQDKNGDLKLIQCGGIETNTDTLAIATSKGTIQLWDVRSKKMTCSWSTKGVGAMQWCGPVLTVGGVKGALRFYDTRIGGTSTTKMKSEARKLTRHQTCITALAWNEPGKLLATGDDSGAVHCWDTRQKVPLDVGEFVQRRKKIQHSVSVTVVNWCPWQPKLLGTGDANGVLQLWNIDASDTRSNALTPGRLELGSRINGLHFSPHCKEMITVHGAIPESSSSNERSQPNLLPGMHNTSNSIVAHSFPTLRHIHTLLAADKVIGASVMNANFTKAVLAVPEENKLKVLDIWGRLKSLHKQSSFMGIR